MAQTTWHYPQSVAQALKLLAAHEGQIMVVGGATTIAAKRDKLPAHLLDLSRCGLEYVRSSEKLISIGAMTRLADLIPQTLPGVGGAFLAKVAESTATTPLRNMITLGGNLAQLLPWSALPLPILAMDAIINLKSGAGRRKIQASKFYGASRFFRPGEIITHIDVPNYQANQAGFSYQQAKRSVTDFPLLTVALFYEQRDGLVTKANIVVGGAKARPQIATQGVELLLNSPVDDVDMEEVSTTVLNDITFASDPRASTEYKQELLYILCHRALQEALTGPVQGVTQ